MPILITLIQVSIFFLTKTYVTTIDRYSRQKYNEYQFFVFFLSDTIENKGTFEINMKYGLQQKRKTIIMLA